MEGLTGRITRVSRLVSALERTEAQSRLRVAWCERVLTAVHAAQERCHAESALLGGESPPGGGSVVWEQQRARAAELLARRASRYAALQARLAARLVRRRCELEEARRARRGCELRMEGLGRESEEAAREVSRREADLVSVARQVRSAHQ